MYKREYLQQLKKQVETGNYIQVITGPRQCGKTTLVEQFMKSLRVPAHYVSADAVPAHSSTWIAQQWETVRFKQQQKASSEAFLIIDEIQKIENWSEYVKKEYDKDKRNRTPVRVILLGSSSLLIQRGLKESLTGRFELLQMPHWSYREMKSAFGFTPEQYVFFGGYPGAVSFMQDETRWRDYMLHAIIETTVSKDILQLTNIHKPALLKRLFDITSLYSGEIVSYNKMLGQLQDAGNTTTLAHYQELLNQAWMIAGLQKYSASAVVEKGSSPKWIAYNNAFTSAIQQTDFSAVSQDPLLWGRRVQQAVGAHLINLCRVQDIGLFYWRERDTEVDFVLRKGSKIIAIEVKTGTDSYHKGIASFIHKFKPYKSYLVSEEGINWKEFLGIDPADLF